jgi:hypothetical protein
MTALEILSSRSRVPALLVLVIKGCSLLQGLSTNTQNLQKGAPFILRRLKELASWVGLATFEALEFFALGIHGKLALWRALQITAPFDSRLAGMDFEQLPGAEPT